jgi:hypothetical protein
VTTEQPVNWVKVGIQLTDYVNWLLELVVELMPEEELETNQKAYKYRGPLELFQELEKQKSLWTPKKRRYAIRTAFDDE